MAEQEYSLSDCMNWETNEDGDCGGRVEERLSRSGLTVSIKCENCYNKLQERLDEIDRQYPDSDIPPAWFDPTYAGESWNGDY